MILIVVAILLVIAGIIALWRGPVSQSADSLQQGGSSKTESYVVILVLAVVLIGSVYMIIQVV